MDAVKIYHQLNPEQAALNFKIARMQDIYAEREGHTDEAHRHDYFTVLVVEDADGEHRIDFNAYVLGKKEVFFVSPGQVHQVIEKRASRGFVMTFSMQFLVENSISMDFIDGLNLFQEYGQSPPLKPKNNAFEKLIHFCKSILELYVSDHKMKTLSIGAYLKLFLIECNNICSIHPIESYTDISESRILKEFKSHVNNHYAQEHSTSFYANLLHITADHLNRVIKTSIGRTAKEYIQSRITTEAKRLLFFSDMNNKEIGYTLGFSEPANFSAFFKKCTGSSPKHFREQEK